MNVIQIENGESVGEQPDGRQVEPSCAMSKSELFAKSVVEAVRTSRKYRDIDPGLVYSLAVAELAKGIPESEVEERVRSKLHQVGGAFFVGEPKFGKALDRLREAAADNNAATWRQVCADIMRKHASTAERLSILPEFYSKILSKVDGPIRSVVDLACGFNPLSWLWMGLAADVEYHCCDIYAGEVEFLNEYFRIADINGRAEVCDLSKAIPQRKVDLAFALKTIPTLEQIDKDAGARLLAEIPARYVVLSWPVRTLSGKNIGMSTNYAQRFEDLMRPHGWGSERFEFANELVFLVKKPSRE